MVIAVMSHAYINYVIVCKYFPFLLFVTRFDLHSGYGCERRKKSFQIFFAAVHGPYEGSAKASHTMISYVAFCTFD